MSGSVPRRPDGGRRLGLTALLVAVALAPGTTPVGAASVVRSERETFRVVTFVEGLEHPWSLAFLPDGRWLVTERPGRLRVVRDGRLDPRPVEGLPEVVEHGQGGLLDVVAHPRYAETGWLYLAYVARGAGGLGTEVLRARLEGHRLADAQVLFRMEPKTGGGRHFGCRLFLDRAGYLFITLGDRGEQDHAQRLDDHRGKVIRLHDDGRVPEDNPFRGRSGARPEIYTYGNRNVQGIALQPGTGRLWTHEHGPQGGDEVNVLVAGTNYGWPVITYGRNYGLGTKIGEGTHKAGMAQPLHVWVPSIAPSGMAFYEGDRFPRWRGHLFVGALRDRLLVRLEVDGDRVVKEERLLADALGRIRDVRVGPDGLLYLLTDARNGAIARLEPAGQ